MTISVIHCISSQTVGKSVEKGGSFLNRQPTNPICLCYSTIIKYALEYNLLLNHDYKEL